ncbi:unnamed protein product [Schistocephalus solidus]|uniref:Apple domain-containing protein n=1 Tax=Schistocephalus solidus TaxID=70667 RepID=A0A183STT4_SCHSO|nr:unnamed protein product [Schistocephalus solidus]
MLLTSYEEKEAVDILMSSAWAGSGYPDVNVTLIKLRAAPINCGYICTQNCDAYVRVCYPRVWACSNKREFDPAEPWCPNMYGHVGRWLLVPGVPRQVKQVGTGAAPLANLAPHCLQDLRNPVAAAIGKTGLKEGNIHVETRYALTSLESVSMFRLCAPAMAIK